MTSKTNHRPSLIQHFAAPDEYYGFFGWVCGYSADSAFLNEAALAFTRSVESQRAGKISLAVMLDPSNIPLVELNGVAHLPLLDEKNKPFRLLHAKVALLGFAHIDDASLWKIRLIVSSGNWTRQTVEESLDLVWTIELASTDLNTPDDEINALCSDIVAANGMLKWVGNYFDKRLLHVRPPDRTYPSETEINLKKLESIVSACRFHARGTGHFFDNRNQSLFDTIVEKLIEKGGLRRNYLALGSGFYEGGESQRQVPQIPREIINKLKEDDFLANSAEVDLYVNPNACQAVATCLTELNLQGITIRRAYTNPDIFGKNTERFLHAKFIFSALTERRRGGENSSNRCKNIWLYLGSGNITKPGLMSTASAHGGNLEAGVMVFPPPMHYWYEKTNDAGRPVVDRLLPLQWEHSFSSMADLHPGKMEKEEVSYYIAPPVVCLYWTGVENGGILSPLEPNQMDFAVLDPANKPCKKNDAGFVWPGQAPAWVWIAWDKDGNEKKNRIPVIDEYGRIGCTELLPLTLDDALGRITAFPLPAEIETTDDEEIANLDDISQSQDGVAQSGDPDYPIRQMMRFLELVAKKQCSLNKESWGTWCLNLEQVLGQFSEDKAVAYFRENLKINPLYPLRVKWFQPAFDQSEPENKDRYIQLLEKAEKKWGTAMLPGLGEDCHD